MANFQFNCIRSSHFISNNLFCKQSSFDYHLFLLSSFFAFFITYFWCFALSLVFVIYFSSFSTMFTCPFIQFHCLVNVAALLCILSILYIDKFSFVLFHLQCCIICMYIYSQFLRINIIYSYYLWNLVLILYFTQSKCSCFLF